jgi:hypothetical protein
MLVPDLLHEFELGVWKATFTHLIQVLYALGEELVATLDSRRVPAKLGCVIEILIFISSSFRSMPTFGQDTICRFTGNVSEM